MHRVGVSIVMFVLLSLLVGTGWALYTFFPDASPPSQETAKKHDTSKDGAKFNTAATVSPGADNPANKSTETKASETSTSAPIDVALIDPNGTSVIAGSAKPKSEVVVSADGVEIATAIADANGDWVLTTEHQFKSPEPKLDITTRAPIQAAANAPPQRPTEAAKRSKRIPQTPTQPASAGVVDRLTEEFEQVVETARQEKSRQDAAPHEDRAATVQAAGAQPKAPITAERTTTVTAREDSQPATRIARAETTKPRLANRETLAIPIPIGFEYREATFTAQGRKAVTLLSEYLAIKQPTSISLTGHADERGSKTLNMDLSQARLEAVARELKKRGYAGKLELIAKGEDEPYAGVDRSKLSKHELYSLDRRVELKVSL